jgi:threonine synthase
LVATNVLFLLYKELKKKTELVFSCPSGISEISVPVIKARLTLLHFVASTNINDTVPRFLANGVYDPKPSKVTISNAMDVGNPSNFIRIQEMYHNDLEQKRTFLLIL